LWYGKKPLGVKRLKTKQEQELPQRKKEGYKILQRTILKQHQGNLDHGQRPHKRIRQTRKRKYLHSAYASDNCPNGTLSGKSAADDRIINEYLKLNVEELLSSFMKLFAK
jgi:hypothetical protein